MKNAPAQPSPTTEDYAEIRKRIESHLHAIGSSKRRAEKAAKFSGGMITKLCDPRSRVVLDVEKLRALATTLQTTPADLVAGTAFEHLLHEAAETPDSKQIVALRAEIDALRAERAGMIAKQSEQSDRLALTATELEELRREREQLLTNQQQQDAKRATLAAQAQTLLEEIRAECAQRSKELRQARSALQEKNADLANASAALEEYKKVARNWREYATAKEQRVAELENALEQWREHAERLRSKGNSDSLATLILGGLVGLGFGGAMSPSSRRSG